MDMFQSGARTNTRKFGSQLGDLGFADLSFWPVVQSSFRQFVQQKLAERPTTRPDPKLGEHLAAAIRNNPQPHFHRAEVDHGPQLGSALRQLMGVEMHHLVTDGHREGWTGDERLGWITRQLNAIFEEEVAHHDYR